MFLCILKSHTLKAIYFDSMKHFNTLSFQILSLVVLHKLQLLPNIPARNHEEESSHSVFPPSVSSRHLHHPDAARQPEQLREPLHLLGFQREASRETARPHVCGRTWTEGVHAGGAHHGQLPVHQPQRPVRQQIVKSLFLIFTSRQPVEYWGAGEISCEDVSAGVSLLYRWSMFNISREEFNFEQRDAWNTILDWNTQTEQVGLPKLLKSSGSDIENTSVLPVLNQS